MKKTNALRILDRHKVSYDLVPYEYDPDNLNVAIIAENCKLKMEVVYKTLVAKGDKTGLLVAVVPGDAQLDYKALAKATSNKKITLIPVKEIQGLTGYIRGGCSPIGMKKDFPVVIEAVAQNHAKIYINAGQRGLLFGVEPKAMCEVSRGIFASISSFES